MTNYHQQGVEAALHTLRMPGALQAYASCLREAEAAHQGYAAFLEAVLTQEVENRRQHQVAHHHRDAHFPLVKTLAAFDFSLRPALNRLTVLQMATGDWVLAKENCLILGNSGTGKSHLAMALGLATVEAGLRVRFTTALALSQDLLAAQADHHLLARFKWWQRYALVIVDELGYLPLPRDQAQMLFQFFAERYERSAVLITSNLEFGRWGEVFGDPTMTTALLDRLTHHAHVLSLTGDSYRFREAQARHAAPQKPVDYLDTHPTHTPPTPEEVSP